MVKNSHPGHVVFLISYTRRQENMMIIFAHTVSQSWLTLNGAELNLCGVFGCSVHCGAHTDTVTRGTM